MYLMPLDKGESLKSKRDRLLSLGFKIATIKEIQDWVASKPKEIAGMDIAIADPVTTPREYVFSDTFTIVQVPGYAILRGIHHRDGWIDLGVPVSNTGDMYILVHGQSTYEI